MLATARLPIRPCLHHHRVILSYITMIRGVVPLDLESTYGDAPTLSGSFVRLSGKLYYAIVVNKIYVMRMYSVILYIPCLVATMMVIRSMVYRLLVTRLVIHPLLQVLVVITLLILQSWTMRLSRPATFPAVVRSLTSGLFWSIAYAVNRGVFSVSFCRVQRH